MIWMAFIGPDQHGLRGRWPNQCRFALSMRGVVALSVAFVSEQAPLVAGGLPDATTSSAAASQRPLSCCRARAAQPGLGMSHRLRRDVEEGVARPPAIPDQPRAVLGQARAQSADVGVDRAVEDLLASDGAAQLGLRGRGVSGYRFSSRRACPAVSLEEFGG
jgi:hypothetical protein